MSRATARASPELARDARTWTPIPPEQRQGMWTDEVRVDLPRRVARGAADADRVGDGDLQQRLQLLPRADAVEPLPRRLAGHRAQAVQARVPRAVGRRVASGGPGAGRVAPQLACACQISARTTVTNYWPTCLATRWRSVSVQGHPGLDSFDIPEGGAQHLARFDKQ